MQDNPKCVDLLARCTEVRVNLEIEIDEYLLDSEYRQSYSVSEVRDLLLDLRRKLDLQP